MTELVKPANGLIKVSMPCYNQVPFAGLAANIVVQVCNVQAEITGTVDPNRTYVYTGHYDSRNLNISDVAGDAPGADDNASAIGIALEMVRILAGVVSKNPPATSIIIAAVAGEEQDLYGSNFLAQTCEYSGLIGAVENLACDVLCLTRSVVKNNFVNVQANFNDDIVSLHLREQISRLRSIHNLQFYLTRKNIYS